MNHAGYIDAQKAYTLGELAQILASGGTGNTTSTAKTLRQHLRSIGCPTPKFGRTILIPGRLIIQALERQALELCSGGEFDDQD